MDVMSIAVNIRRLLAERGMTQGELAEAVGISRQQVSNIINGHVSSFSSRLPAIAEALSVPVGDLFSEGQLREEADEARQLREALKHYEDENLRLRSELAGRDALVTELRGHVATLQNMVAMLQKQAKND